MAWSDPRVLIIGAGAVGSFVGARLALSGAAVTLVGRGPLAEAARSSGLSLAEPEGERRTPPLAAYDSLAGALRASAYDLAILTVKAYDTAVVLAEIAAAAVSPPPILSFQNGIGNEEALARSLGPDRVIAGAIETPLTVPQPGAVIAHRSRYRAGLAPVGSTAPAAEAAAALARAGLRIDLYDDYRRLKWSKLLLNLPANAACAILDWTPAQIMADPNTAALEARAWQEAFRVMRGQGIAPVSLAGYPLSLLAPIIPRLSPSLLARGLRRTVAGGRGSKSPSLRVAMAGGKRSEVGWLNGAVAAAGLATGISTPVNAAFTDILSALAQGRDQWSEWRDQPRRLTTTVANPRI
jgi:2-dehydropantoate 2-reductase